MENVYLQLAECLTLMLAACSSPGGREVDLSEPEQLEAGSPPLIDVPPVEELATIPIKRMSDQNLLVEVDEKSFKAKDDIAVHILNIGAGSCKFIDCPQSNDVMVVDCGSMKPSSTDLKISDIKSYFRKLTVDGGDIKLVLSHPDQDHVNKIKSLMTDYEVKSIWLGGKYHDYRGSVSKFLTAEAKANTPIKHGWKSGWSNHAKPVKGLSCGAADTYVLAVNAGGSKNANSMMLRLEYGDFSIVLAGDAESVSENAAMDAYGQRLTDTTVVTASHHGAKTHRSNSQKWIDRLAPRVVVYSSGTSHGHPNAIAVQRFRKEIDSGFKPHKFWTATSSKSSYKKSSTTLSEYVTELSRTIVVKSDGSAYDIECSKEAHCF